MMAKEKRNYAQNKLSAEKLAERHFNEVQTRYSLVKGERIICLSIPLPLINNGNVLGRATRFCILFRLQVLIQCGFRTSIFAISGVQSRQFRHNSGTRFGM